MNKSALEALERRREPRAGCVLRLSFRNAGHLLVSYCTNLSRGGLFIPTQSPLAVGAKLSLEVTVPGLAEKPVHLSAEVRWVRRQATDEGQAGMGLAFEDVDRQLGARIDALVSEFTPLCVVLLGERLAVRSHLAAQVRSIVTCQTLVASDPAHLPHDLERAHLIIVDIDSSRSLLTSVVHELVCKAVAPPIVVTLDSASAPLEPELAERVHVVSLPADPETLADTVLRALTSFQTVNA